LHRLLVIEDDDDDFFIFSELVNSIPGYSFIIDRAKIYPEALEKICMEEHDLYFLDYFLGEKNGLDLLADARVKNCSGPVILLTGAMSRQIDLKAVELGVVDYLSKSELTEEKLERCIRYSLERNATLKALHASERKYRSIFENSKDLIFLADINFALEELNYAASDLFSTGINIFTRFSDPELARRLEEALRTSGKIENTEVEINTLTEEKRNFILSVFRETDLPGQLYYQGIMRDITQAKKIEKASRQIERLESSAALLRTLAHEIRNPLTTIRLSVEYLRDDLKEQTELLQMIERNLQRIEGLITELLNSARPGSIVPQKTVLQNLLDQASALAEDRVSLKRIRVNKEYPPDAAYIMADPEKLIIALVNIIINAVESMSEGLGSLDLGVFVEKDKYIVHIKDNGTGISAENLGKIFEPYFTSKSNGFGLGLSSSMNILRSHGANVDVESEPGKGTTFYIGFSKAAST
jgi:PAS domain S-box-containing protein